MEPMRRRQRRSGMQARIIVTTALLVLAGCDGDARDGARATRSDAGTVRIEPVVLSGGVFVEGFVAAYELDPDDRRSLDGTQLDAAVKLGVQSGTHELLVTVQPCVARCMGWERTVEAMPDADYIRCRATFEVGGEETVTLTPVLRLGPLDELTPDGPPCSVEERRSR